MRRIVLDPQEIFTTTHLKRSSAFDDQALAAALDIVKAVRDNGDAALSHYTEKFDGVAMKDFRVSPHDIKTACAAVDPQLMAALQKAAERIRAFHERQLQQSWFATSESGALVGAKITPLDSVGIYVPGGRALYPSTLLMNALPALVAGVKRIVVVSPPTKDGSLDAAIMATAQLAGVTEIYAVGGAQAIAALAYGTDQIDAVDKICGPGNAFVAAAKKIVSGDVGIDMIAGPSEVCIVADETADPSLVAIDLMAQAEHDPHAACYLVTNSSAYADKVEQNIARYLEESARKKITATSLEQKGLIVIVNDRPQALQVVNVIAPEHLELHFDHPMDSLGAIQNAGAIFMGAWTPEAVGDYLAGPNHTLPTGGTARFSSPLSVDDFVKKSSIIQYSKQALFDDAEAIATIAHHEGLWAHARSVELRCNIT